VTPPVRRRDSTYGYAPHVRRTQGQDTARKANHAHPPYGTAAKAHSRARSRTRADDDCPTLKRRPIPSNKPTTSEKKRRPLWRLFLGCIPNPCLRSPTYTRFSYEEVRDALVGRAAIPNCAVRRRNICGTGLPPPSLPSRIAFFCEVIFLRTSASAFSFLRRSVR